MLYERWLQNVQNSPRELAVVEFATGRRWTFLDLEEEVQRVGEDGTQVRFPQGQGIPFLIDVLRGWRDGAVVMPMEVTQNPPALDFFPVGCVHLKTTSATSGAPKGVAFTAEQLEADARQIIQTMGLSREWPNVAVLSMAHSYGFSNLVTPLLLFGIPLILLEAPLPDLVRQAMQQLGPVTLPGVPALWKLWHEAGVLSDQIKIAISAGAPLPLTLEQEIFFRNGIKVHNFYGASECGGIAYDRTESPRQEASHVGTAMCGVDLEVDDTGTLVVRSPAVGLTYWPEPSGELRDGVYQTSDVAELDHGVVHLLGRKNDVINLSGRKLAPENVERALGMHPGVRCCVVFGVPAEDARTEKIVACVNAPGCQSGQLRDYLLSVLNAWQIPRDWWLTEELTVNHRGKISRAQWRERYLDQQTHE